MQTRTTSPSAQAPATINTNWAVLSLFNNNTNPLLDAHKKHLEQLAINITEIGSRQITTQNEINALRDEEFFLAQKKIQTTVDLHQKRREILNKIENALEIRRSQVKAAKDNLDKKMTVAHANISATESTTAKFKNSLPFKKRGRAVEVTQSYSSSPVETPGTTTRSKESLPLKQRFKKRDHDVEDRSDKEIKCPAIEAAQPNSHDAARAAAATPATCSAAQTPSTIISQPISMRHWATLFSVPQKPNAMVEFTLKGDCAHLQPIWEQTKELVREEVQLDIRKAILNYLA